MIVVRQEVIDNSWTEIAMYPASIPVVSEAVPAVVSNDFISGVNCLSIGETKAEATMFRRSLQQVALNKKAKGKTLFAQLEWLQENSAFPQEVIDWAHEIRFWGNDGAHPTNDGLDDITPEQAQEVKTFIESVFEWVYIMPDKVVTPRQNRVVKKAEEEAEE